VLHGCESFHAAAVPFAAKALRKTAYAAGFTEEIGVDAWRRIQWDMQLMPGQVRGDGTPKLFRKASKNWRDGAWRIVAGGL